MASPVIDPSVAAYYDERIKLTDPSNTSQLAALNAEKNAATQAYTGANTDYTQDLFKIMSMGPGAVNNDPQLSKERDALISGGFLKDVAGNAGEGNTAESYQLGENAPHNFAQYSATGDTPKNELSRLVNVNQAKSNNQTLRDSNMVAHTQLWGDMTYQGNIVQPSSGWDTFWKIAPTLPMLFASMVSGGALSPLLKLMLTASKDAAMFEMNKPGS